MSKTQKWLLALGLLLLLLAEGARRLPVSAKSAVVIGAAEVILAAAFGVAFALAATGARGRPGPGRG
jgi:hypothetical protein